MRQFMNALSTDATLALRALRRAPQFAMAAVATLTLGVAAVATVFSVAYSILLAPLPIRSVRDVVVLWGDNPSKQPEHFPLWGPEYRAFAHDARSYTALAATDYYGALPRPAEIGDTTAFLRMNWVTGNFFDVLGARPLIGRLLRPSDDVYGARFAVVLSQPTWRTLFGADSAVAGRSIRILGRDAQIVGVLAGMLDYPRGVQLWASAAGFFGARDTLPGFYDLVGRLAPGATPASASREFGAWLERGDVPHSGARRLLGDTLRPMAARLTDVVVGDVRPAMRVVVAAGLLLMLVTCMNVANLLLVRAVGRRREFAVKAALGGGRLRLGRQVLLEALLLAVIAGLAGTACAIGAVRAFVAVAPGNLPRLSAISPNAPVLLASVALAALVTLVFAWLPAVAGARISLVDDLRDRARAMSPRSQRLRRALVALQVGVAVATLAIAGVVTKGFLSLAHVDLGFRTDRLVTARLGTRQRLGVGDEPRIRAALLSTLQSIRSIPGVVDATGMTSPPFRAAAGNDLVYSLPGDVPGAPTHRPLVDYLGAGEDYFRTFGISIKRGRGFQANDRSGAEQVAVVDEILARQAWPGEDAIGKRIGIGTNYFTVVGVAGSTRYRDLYSPRGTLYTPEAQGGPGWSFLAIRLSGDSRRVIPMIQAAFREHLPTITVAAFQTLDDEISDTLAQPRLDALLLATFGVMVLLITTVGLYAVATAFVKDREFEIGLRSALGAAPHQVRWHVLRQGRTLVGAGIAGGSVLALAGSTAVGSLLYTSGVSPHDVAAFIIAIGLVGAVSALSFFIPAQRASRANPAEVLRKGG